MDTCCHVSLLMLICWASVPMIRFIAICGAIAAISNSTRTMSDSLVSSFAFLFWIILWIFVLIVYG